jgi:hypothetical protein
VNALALRTPFDSDFSRDVSMSEVRSARSSIATCIVSIQRVSSMKELRACVRARMHACLGGEEPELKEGAWCQQRERAGRSIASLRAHVRYVVSSEEIKSFAIRLDSHSCQDPVEGHSAFTVESPRALVAKQCPGPHDSAESAQRWEGERV